MFKIRLKKSFYIVLTSNLDFLDKVRVQYIIEAFLLLTPQSSHDAEINVVVFIYSDFIIFINKEVYLCLVSTLLYLPRCTWEN